MIFSRNPSPAATRRALVETSELVVNSVLKTVSLAGRRPVDALGDEVPFRLLETLLGRPGLTVSRQVLFEAAWGVPYRGRADDSRLSYNLARLRRMLHDPPRAPGRLLRRRRGYALNPAVPLRWIQDEADFAPSGTADASGIALWAASRGRVTNRDLRRRFGLSRSGALRALRRLARAGIVAPKGRGRGANHTICACIPSILSL
ncbi:MAG: winged helix-turn-helix domain-containing protein [Candidatus Wallbacteria bacterium]|nr:winged helix-turn-helix domain-containing protein [Candidatus Wallbacteria bacterium]